MPSARSFLRPVLSLTTSVALAAGTLAATSLPAQAAGELPALVITEINVDSSNRQAADGSSVDAFEFIEVRNTTDAPVDLADAGYSVVYLSGSNQKTLTHDDGVTVAANGSLVLWPRNSGLTGDAAVTEQDFRDFYAGLGWEGAFDLAVLSGQNGLNNSGSTMWIRHTEAGATTDVAQVSWSAGDKGVDRTVEYVVPSDGSAVQRVLATQQDPNPGAVRDEQLDPTPPPAPPTAPELFVSEVLPDNGTHTFTDAGGVQRTSTQDNFEMLEVANTTDAAIDLADHTLVYNGTATLALTAGKPHTVPARGTLVLWLDYQSGSADGWSGASPNSSLFTDADFRDHYGIGADVPVGHVTGQAGMANSGGARTLRSGTQTAPSAARRTSRRTTSARGSPSTTRPPASASPTRPCSPRSPPRRPGRSPRARASRRPRRRTASRRSRRRRRPTRTSMRRSSRSPRSRRTPPTPEVATPTSSSRSTTPPTGP